MSASVQPVARNLRQFPDLHPPLNAQSARAEANRCFELLDRSLARAPVGPGAAAAGGSR